MSKRKPSGIAAIASWVLPALVCLAGCGGSGSSDEASEDAAGDSTRSEAESRRSLEALAYLGFVKDDPAPEKKGVVLYDRERASKGVNLYVPGGYEAQLIGMDGTVLHAWTAPEQFGNGWLMPELSPDGSLLVIDGVGGMVDHALLKLDWDSNLEWVNRLQHHHDIAVAGNGEIYTPTKERREVPYRSGTLPIKDNSITVLSPGGEVLKSVSIYDLLEEHLPVELLAEAAADLARWEAAETDTFRAAMAKGFDLFHTNSVELIPRDIGVANKGDVLICMRNRDAVAIFDAALEKLLWLWGPGQLDWPHHPSVLKNGDILVFDNGPHRSYSRLVEVDPRTGQIVWTWKGDVPRLFFTYGRGGAQELPNGNVLVTESGKGHVFEITRSGEKVWEFWNPEFNEKGERVIIYRMARYTGDMLSRMSLDPALEERLRSLGYVD